MPAVAIMLEATSTAGAARPSQLRAMGTRKTHVHVARTRRPCRVTVPRPAIGSISSLPLLLPLRLEHGLHAAV